MDDDTKVTVTGSGQSAITTLGGIKTATEKLKEATKVKDVEGLLSLHNDEQTTKEINKDWQELRGTVDGRASLEEKKVKGKLTITIDYEADSDTGKKEITITRCLTLPKPPSNTRTLYEDKEGNLQTVKPTKQLDLYDNVTPIKRKNV